MSKLPQSGWSHGMLGVGSEVASRPYKSIGLPEICTSLHCFRTSVSSTTMLEHHRMVQVGGDPGGHMVKAGLTSKPGQFA